MNQHVNAAAWSIPEGWVWTDLAAIAHTTSGGTPRRDRPQFYGGKIPWLKSGELGDRTVFEVEEYITEEGLQNSSAKIFPMGTLCIALYGATVGKLAILGIDSATNQAVCGISPANGVDPKFLFRFFELIRPQLVELGKGGAQPNISQGIVRSTSLPLASSNEQHRIVAEIEKQFTRLDAAVTALKRVQANLRRYRAAVLKAACEGRLVPTEAELARKESRSYETGEQLLTGILKERRAKWEADQLAKMQAAGKPPKDDNWKSKYPVPAPPDPGRLSMLPAGWTWASVDQLAIVVRGASPRPAGDPRYFGGDIPWITVGALTADEQPFLRAISDFVTQAGREASRFIPADTLLLTNSGATLGVPKITLIGGCINDGSVALFHLDYPLKMYLYYFLTTQTRSLRRINQGAAQPNLNTSIVKAIPIPLPPLPEQDRIIGELERKLSAFAVLSVGMRQDMTRANRLRQSILKCAFKGKLMPQDPNDEPASVLLERIRTERAERLQALKQTQAKLTKKLVSAGV